MEKLLTTFAVACMGVAVYGAFVGELGFIKLTAQWLINS